MQQSTAAMAANQRAPTPTTNNRTNNRGRNWHQQAWDNMQQTPHCPSAFNTMQTSGGNTQANPVAFSRIKIIVTPTAITSKTSTQAKPVRRPATITIQTPPDSTPWVDPTPGRTRPSCRHITVANPAPDLSVSPAQATYNGEPQNPRPGPITGAEAVEDSRRAKWQCST